MILAETQPLSSADHVLWAWLVLGTFAAIIVFGRALREIRGNGVKTRPDLLGVTDILVAVVLIASIFLLRQLGLLMFPVIVMLWMVARDVDPVDFFGLRRVGLVAAVFLGLGFALVALPLTTVVKQITLLLTHSQEAPQQLVQKFNDAATSGNWSLIWQIAISATIIAPFAEEILFRGYFYPVISRGVGRILSTFVVAVLFGAAHDTLADIPGLAVLSICLTLAYERTGSLLVPVLFHAWFNGISLVALWLQVRYGGTP